MDEVADTGAEGGGTVGRLIDADALKRRCQKVATEAWKMKMTTSVETVMNQVIDFIEEAPTIQPDAPRVMTMEEATNAECVFYDWRTRGVRPAKLIRVPYKTGTYRVQLFGDIDEWVHADEYGEYWLCWTAMPTEEQRKAVKWDAGVAD